MTRPGHVLVEFPVEEAEALLAHGSAVRPMTESDEFGAAIDRLQRAVNIERGPGGSAQRFEQMEKAA